MPTAGERADEALRLGIMRGHMALHVPATLKNALAGRVGACLEENKRVLRQRSIPDEQKAPSKFGQAGGTHKSR